MTEYDYSPDAYERYMENRSRVARWVDNTDAHSHEFRSPFGTRSDIEEDEYDDGMMDRERGGMHDSHYGGRGYSRRRGGGGGDGYDDFHGMMSAGLSTVGASDPYSSSRPSVNTGAAGAIPQSYLSVPRAPGPIPAQTSYGSLYPPYLSTGPVSQPNVYPASPAMVSTSTSPPPPVIIQVPRHHSRHHHHHHRDRDHHHSSSHTSSEFSRSRSKSKSRPLAYIIPPPPPPVPQFHPSSVPMQYTAASPSVGYPPAPLPPPPPPPQTAGSVAYATSGYPAAGGVISPTPTYGYPSPSKTFTASGKTITSGPGYVIVSPRGRGVRVVHA
ncbi:hypothetical protein K435DRAFT_878990 [Dendrothele bispora CBS 962.96]|uniref:Uncharacterized protein n=1 Tax=Dendrothele bispora (strain CBS 962.96) TaxID=1314807 RepID=A0A4S8KM74_DENBC|nr:hypothetical protein K435DRAFT_878990 [Dendrothele bispora CBS 962.96]